MTMAKDANVFARVDASLKEQAEGILSQLGMPMSSAINIFLNQIVLRRGLPFEFYAEVKRGYDDCAAGRTRPAEDVFRDIEAEFGL